MASSLLFPHSERCSGGDRVATSDPYGCGRPHSPPVLEESHGEAP